MNYFIPIILTVVFLACQSDDELVIVDDDMPVVNKSCVINEEIKNSATQNEIFKLGSMENGFAEAIKIDSIFRASLESIILTDSTLSLYLLTYYNNVDPAALTEIISFEKMAIDTGCLEIVNSTSFTKPFSQTISSYRRTDFDITKARFVVNESASNFIEITKLDIVNKKISGELMVSYVKKDSLMNPNTYIPNRVRFYNGHFEGKLRYQ